MNSNSQHRLPNTTLGAIALALLAAVTLSGCASNKMALEASKGGAAKLKKPVGIFTLRTETPINRLTKRS